MKKYHLNIHTAEDKKKREILKERKREWENKRIDPLLNRFYRIPERERERERESGRERGKQRITTMTETLMATMTTEILMMTTMTEILFTMTMKLKSQSRQLNGI